MTERSEARRPVNLDKDLLAILCCPDTKQEVGLAENALIAKLNAAVISGQLKTGRISRSPNPRWRIDQKRQKDAVSYPRRHSGHAHRRRYPLEGMT